MDYRTGTKRESLIEKTLAFSNFNKGERLMEIAIIDEGLKSQYIWYRFKTLEELQSWCQTNVKNEEVLASVMKPLGERKLKNIYTK
jgi:hypothetical protein